MQTTFLHSGQVGRDLLTVDWSATALGPLDAWPRSLQAVVRMVLASRFPMWMGWGEELTFFCNDAYRRDTLGAKYPWALGKPAPVVWSEVWDEVKPRIDQVLSTGEATWDEKLLLFLERSGYREETYHTFSYSPLADDSGAIAGMLCVVSEDTEEVIAHRRMRTLRDIGSAATSGRTEDETVTAVCSALDQSAHDIPFHFVYLYDEWGAPRYVGGTHYNHERPIAPDGELPALIDLDAFPELPMGAWPTAPRQAAVVPIRGPQETPYGFLMAGLNPFRPYDKTYADFLDLVTAGLAAAVTDARAYELERHRAETLAELDQAKTDFFTNISHEFRTPLTLLLGPAEDALTDRDDPLSPLQRERTEVMRHNALRLLRLVNALLDFSRLESGRMQASFEPVDLGDYTRSVASTFASAAERLGLALEIHDSPLPATVYVDRDLWGKVVLNLLSNAVKFTLEGTISVAVRPDGDRALLSVTDSGIGIPSDQVPHLFERFHRVPDTASRTHEGSGIGLALVAELVELHSGSVSVHSTAGRGTTFEVRLPYGADHLPADQVGTATGRGLADDVVGGFLAETTRFRDGGVPAPVLTRRTGDRPRVLVVDDNVDVRHYIAGLLDSHYDVDTAVDGHDALDQARADVPDLVLTDVMMPRLDGFGLLAALRSDPVTANVPIVVLSARAGEEGLLEGLEAGADDYLVKPFTARELVARVRTTLELDKARHEAAVRERQIADELQASLLPMHDFDLEHLEVATYYRAGVQGTQVGGDWYDVIHLSEGRTGLVLGDVMGRGVRAAAVMGQLRTAVRAYSLLGLPPDMLMTSLDRLVWDLFPEQVVTCLYAVYDPADRVLGFVNAGHLPPLITHPDGSCSQVEVSAHPPLGLGKPFDEVHTIALEPGGGVLLYTDGLVERRGQDLEAGIESLRKLAEDSDAPLRDLPSVLVSALLPDGPDDDVAVLVAQVPGK